MLTPCLQHAPVATRVPSTSMTASSEEVGRLLFPELPSDLIEDVLEDVHVVGGEASAEVTSRVGSGMRVGAECVEEDDIIASQFDVVEARAIAQGVCRRSSERGHSRDKGGGT